MGGAALAGLGIEEANVSRYRVVEICAGAGGQSLGLEPAGFEHELSAELTDRRVCNTLLRRGFTSHACVRRWQVRSLRFKTEDGPAPPVWGWTWPGRASREHGHIDAGTPARPYWEPLCVS
jgi:hypothetical protein